MDYQNKLTLNSRFNSNVFKTVMVITAFCEGFFLQQSSKNLAIKAPLLYLLVIHFIKNEYVWFSKTQILVFFFFIPIK